MIALRALLLVAALWAMAAPAAALDFYVDQAIGSDGNRRSCRRMAKQRGGTSAPAELGGRVRRCRPSCRRGWPALYSRTRPVS